MSEHWFRYYHGTPADPKFRVIAARARNAMERHATPTKHDVTVASVLAVFDTLLDTASQASPRGSIEAWDSEDIAALLELDITVVEAIYDAMEGKVRTGNMLTAWEKRQPKRERTDEIPSTGRVRKHRALHGSKEPDETTERQETPTQHQETPRGEEKREEKERALSVGEGEKIDTREPDPPPTPRVEIGTATGRAAKALRAGGVAHVNPSHPALLRLIAAGVTEQELTDAAIEAKAIGKASLPYVCGVVEGRRRDAAERGAVPAGAANRPVAGSGAHRPYVPEPRAKRTVGTRGAETQAMADIMARLNIHQKPAEESPDPDPRNQPQPETRP